MLRMICLLALMFASIPAYAQETPQPPTPTCSMEELQPVFENWQNAVTRFDETFAAGDVQAVYETMLGFDLVFDMVRAMCNPLTWSGNGDLVIGPVFVESGAYRLLLEGEELTSVDSESLTDGCFSIYAYVDIGQTRTEEVYRSSGCSMLLEVDASGDWTLTFEKVA
jgi:hypothetical protein